MVSWVLIAFVIIFPLIQVPLVIYIGRYTKLKEGERPARPPVRDFWEEGEGGGDEPSAPEPATQSPDTLTCPECGSENDTQFRYCGDCAASLYAAAD